jgi:hypothetical protein
MGRAHPVKTIRKASAKSLPRGCITRPRGLNFPGLICEAFIKARTTELPACCPTCASPLRPICYKLAGHRRRGVELLEDLHRFIHALIQVGNIVRFTYGSCISSMALLNFTGRKRACLPRASRQGQKKEEKKATHELWVTNWSSFCQREREPSTFFQKAR